MAKLGVVGVGAMGRHHVRVASSVGELVGISDLNVNIGKPMAEKYGTSFFKDYNDLFKQDLDGVVIVTPTNFHKDVALAAIEHGLNVLVEKPIAPSVEDGQAIVDAAADAGVTLAVGHIERHNPIVKFTNEHLMAGLLGTPINMSSRRVSMFPARVRDVGVILDFSVHDIDTIRFLAHSEVVKVAAMAGRFKHEKAEDYANILMEFESGLQGHVEVNWHTPMKVRKIFLTCEKGYAEMDYINQTLKVSTSSLPKPDDFPNTFNMPVEFQKREYRVKAEEPLKLEHLDFINAFEKGQKPLVTGEDGVSVIKIAIAAIESYQKGEVIRLD